MDCLISSTPIHFENLLISPFRPPIKTITLNPRTSKISSLRASSTSNPNPSPNPIVKSVKTAASAAIVLSAASASFLSGRLPARADPVVQETESEAETRTETIEFSSETINSLKALVYQKLEEGEDSEALTILNRLISYQPSTVEWKFLAARILNEMGEANESRKLYEEILAIDPLLFEALFENAVLMDRCGEGEAVIERLEQALEIARSEENEKSARDVRLIMAQIKYLQKNVDEALEDYEELIKEDSKDYRPYFCQGVILSLLERNKEAKEKFAKYKELAPAKFEVDAYLQTSLSRAKIIGTED
ncbi:uncharacterized protein A4U43_C04F4520 [Asparagus officinalis]|uniref:Uncharacterized protein n=1 Tax=Asparagus officinalis TaxID=4686 RepID=A0A5P1F372_ASPOF|nr:protein SLOW GREEN 1, chloroplastic [Asparagus officinalis]ONK71081.1 uncharacterized protein A4U43_C04F4520 [Asparagus officinalis]